MWGKLVDFAAAAAEQVQKEAISIANDGFDLLDKLDSTINDDDAAAAAEEGAGEGEETATKEGLDGGVPVIDNTQSLPGDSGSANPDGPIGVEDGSAVVVEMSPEKLSTPAAVHTLPETEPTIASTSIADATSQPSFVSTVLPSLSKIVSPSKPSGEAEEVPSTRRAINELKSLLCSSPSATVEDLVAQVREVLEECAQQAQVIRGLSEAVDAREAVRGREVAELKQQLVQSNGRISILETALDEADKRAEETALSYTTLVDSLRADLSVASARVTELEAHFAESQSQWESDKEALLSKCMASESDYDKLSSNLVAKDSELQSALQKLEESSGDAASLNAKIEALSLELRTAEETRSSIETEQARQMEAIAEANRNLTKQLEEARKQQKGKKGSKNADETNELKSKLTQANERIAALEMLKSEETSSFQTQISALTEAHTADQQAITELRQQLLDKESSSKVQGESGKRASSPIASQMSTSENELPMTPTKSPSQSQMAGFDSPDESSFKTPGAVPNSGGGKSKLKLKGKSKAEVANEIKTLNSQLHSLKAMQTSLSSELKQSMSQINQELTTSIVASLVPQMTASAPVASASSTQVLTEPPINPVDTRDVVDQVLQLEQAAEKYEQQLKAFQAEKDQLQSSLVSTEMELVEVKARLEDSLSNNANLSESLTSCNSTIADLQAARDQSASSNANLQSDIAALKASIDGKCEEISAAQAALGEKDAELRALQEKLSNLDNGLAAERAKLEEDYREQISALNMRNEELTARIFFLETLASEAAEKSALVGDLQKEVKALQESAADAEMRQCDLELSINQKTHEIRELESAKIAIEAHLSQAQAKYDEDVQSRDNELVRLNELLSKNVDSVQALEMERDRSQQLAQKIDELQKQVATLQSELQSSKDDCHLITQKHESEHSKMHGKLAEAVEMIERLKEVNESQKFDMSAKAKHVADLEAQISKTQRALDESNAKLGSLQDEIAHRVLAESALREKGDIMQSQIASMTRERDEYKSAKETAESRSVQLAENLANLQLVADDAASKCASAEERLESITRELEKKNTQVNQLSKKLNDTQLFASSVDDLKAELDRANEKLSKLDDKKKKDLENLRKQNELIAKVNRDKDELERSLSRTISDLTTQLDDSNSSKATLEIALKESKEALSVTVLELDELRVKLATLNDPSKNSDESKTVCSECVRLKDSLDAAHKSKETEMEVYSNTIKMLEQDISSIRDQLSSRDRSMRELSAQCDELQKECDALLVAQSTASSLGPQVIELQGRIRELQAELDKATIKTKQQELSLSDANASVSRLRMELSATSQQLSDLKSGDSSSHVQTSMDIESGGPPFTSGDVVMRTPHSTSSGRAKGLTTPSNNAIIADADDIKGKDDWDGVNPILLQVWSFLRQRAPSMVPERPPSRKLVMLCAQIYLLILHVVAVLSVSYIKHSCK